MGGRGWAVPGGDLGRMGGSRLIRATDKVAILTAGLCVQTRRIKMTEIKDRLEDSGLPYQHKSSRRAKTFAKRTLLPGMRVRTDVRAGRNCQGSGSGPGLARDVMPYGRMGNI